MLGSAVQANMSWSQGATPKPPTREHERLSGQHGALASWRRWGPYVSERSWGTVR